MRPSRPDKNRTPVRCRSNMVEVEAVVMAVVMEVVMEVEAVMEGCSSKIIKACRIKRRGSSP